MLTHLAQAVYVVAAVLFILSLAGLSRQTSARRGVTLGMIGMVLALGATVMLAADQSERPVGVTIALIIAVLAIGAAIGAWRARSVEMTQMPELIAILHSFVGLAAVAVGFDSYLTERAHAGYGGSVHLVEVFLGILIGAVTFTGSIVAYLKLSAKMRSAPLTLPGRNWLNLGAGGLCGAARLVRGGPRERPGRAGHHDRDRAAARLPHGGRDRRRGHARGGLDAQLLLRVGGGRGRLHAGQRPAHRHRRWSGPPVRSSATSCARP